jgi:hypothetical protein
MNNSTAETSSMADAFKTGYSRKQIITSIAFAVLLHGTILGAYIVLGGEKKSSKTAEKSEKKDDAKVATPVLPAGDSKADANKAESTDPAKKSPGPTADSKKNSDVAKPGEIPAAPDSDIDSILKAK